MMIIFFLLLLSVVLSQPFNVIDVYGTSGTGVAAMCKDPSENTDYVFMMTSESLIMRVQPDSLYNVTEFPIDASVHGRPIYCVVYNEHVYYGTLNSFILEFDYNINAILHVYDLTEFIPAGSMGGAFVNEKGEIGLTGNPTLEIFQLPDFTHVETYYPESGSIWSVAAVDEGWVVGSKDKITYFDKNKDTHFIHLPMGYVYNIFPYYHETLTKTIHLQVVGEEGLMLIDLKSFKVLSYNQVDIDTKELACHSGPYVYVMNVDGWRAYMFSSYGITQTSLYVEGNYLLKHSCLSIGKYEINQQHILIGFGSDNMGIQVQYIEI